MTSGQIFFPSLFQDKERKVQEDHTNKVKKNISQQELTAPGNDFLIHFEED